MVRIHFFTGGYMGYGITGTIVIGFSVGLVARALEPGNNKMGFILTTLLGIIGASAGLWLGQMFGMYQVGEPIGFIGAVVGAMIVLFAFKLIVRKK